MTDADRGAGALLARVIVNRLWQHHFGDGLVRTPNDFGIARRPPDHPELLEWLAGELVADGWRLKRLHRLIVPSAAYRQGECLRPGEGEGRPRQPAALADAARRLEAEVDPRRDAGRRRNAEPEMYGPAFKPPIPAEAIVTRNCKDPVSDGHRGRPGVRRRTVYAVPQAGRPVPAAPGLRRAGRPAMHRPAADHDGRPAGPDPAERPVRSRTGPPTSPRGF